MECGQKPQSKNSPKQDTEKGQDKHESVSHSRHMFWEYEKKKIIQNTDLFHIKCGLYE